jgi:hypothetical protein
MVIVNGINLGFNMYGKTVHVHAGLGRGGRTSRHYSTSARITSQVMPSGGRVISTSTL